MKNYLKTYLKIFNIRSSSAGFTLIELMIAMALTTIVVSAAGFGLVSMTNNNKKAEAKTQRRIELSRALDFISDDIRMASSISDTSVTAPTWATNNDTNDPDNQLLDWINNLGGGSPFAKLYMQIPIKFDKIATSSITAKQHGFSAGNAVNFTGSDTDLAAANLSKDVVYYVTKDPATDSFKVSNSISNATNGVARSLNDVASSGSLTVNRLLIYYIRTNTSTWLPPRTINRSAGPCLDPYEASNCPALVDSIADTNGFTASVTSSRQAELRLLGKISNNSTQTYEVSTKVFARANP